MTPEPKDRRNNMRIQTTLVFTALIVAMAILPCCSALATDSKDDFEKQVEDYIQKFPYQNTHEYAMKFTGGDAGKLNQWDARGQA